MFSSFNIDYQELRINPIEIDRFNLAAVLFLHYKVCFAIYQLEQKLEVNQLVIHELLITEKVLRSLMALATGTIKNMKPERIDKIYKYVFGAVDYTIPDIVLNFLKPPSPNICERPFRTIKAQRID